MNITASSRLASIPSYPFDVIRKKVAALRAAGVDVIDLGVGDPVRPAPDSVRARCKEAVDRYASSGYPPYRGIAPFLEAAAGFMQRAFGVALDPRSQVLATIGSKEAIFHLPAGLLDPGDFVLIPSPSYPPYTTGTIFAGGAPIYYPLDAGGGFLPDLDFIRETLEKPPAGGKIRLMWTCYPNSPTGAVTSKEYYGGLLGLLACHGVILASDEAYCDFVYRGERATPLQAGAEGVIAFYSFSKRSNMTGHRVGWAAGDRRLVDLLLGVKTNLDSGTPCFVQEGAVAALEDDAGTARMKEEYRRNRDLLADAFTAAGLSGCRPDGALYVWQKAPPGMTSERFAEALLSPRVGVVSIQGRFLGSTLPDGRNPGEGYVRLSLTALPERVAAAAERIRAHLPEALGKG